MSACEYTSQASTYISFFILYDVFTTYLAGAGQRAFPNATPSQDVEKAAQVFLRDAPIRVGGTKHEVIVHY